MKKLTVLVIISVMLILSLNVWAYAEVDLNKYHEALTGVWTSALQNNSNRPKYSFSYPGKASQLMSIYDMELFLVASEQKAYLVVGTTKLGGGAAWYEILLSEDNEKLILVGDDTFSGLYLKQ